MKSFLIEKGLVISRLEQVLEYDSRAGEEFYFRSPSNGALVTIHEDDFWPEFASGQLKVLEAFSSPKLLLTEINPVAPRAPLLSGLSEVFQNDLDRKLRYITKLRELGISRGQTPAISRSLPQIAQEIQDPHGVPGCSTVQRWWQEFVRSGNDPGALVSKNAYRERHAQIDADSNAFAEQIIDDKFASSLRPSARSAWRDYKAALNVENLTRLKAGKPPLYQFSSRTFERRIDARPKKEMMEAREGYQAARRHFHMIKGHLPSEHILDVAEIDHTPLNLYVIDDAALLPLGRPWLTALKDRNSGMILGFYVSFQATGLDTIFGAIKHSLNSHREAYKLWPELENPWPAHGKAAYYLSDRGADFLSLRYRNAISALGSLYEYCERRTPWLKGGIERFFLTLEQTLFETIPGRTFASLAERGDYDPQKDAVVRFSTLIFLLHKWAADFHNIFPNSRTGVRPLDRWNESAIIAPPGYPISPEELNIALGDHYSGRLSQEGIRFQWLDFADGQLSSLMDVIGKGKFVDYVVCREDLGHIYVKDPRTEGYIMVPCTRGDYASGLSLFQHQFLRKENGLKNEASRNVDYLMETRAIIQDRILVELDLKKTTAKARLANVAGISSNKVLEGEARSIVVPFPGTERSGQANRSEQAKEASFTNVPSYAWGV